MRKGSCISCGQGLIHKGSTIVPCPQCEQTLGRCGDCREQAVAFSCPGCGYAGP